MKLYCLHKLIINEDFGNVNLTKDMLMFINEIIDDVVQKFNTFSRHSTDKLPKVISTSGRKVLLPLGEKLVKYSLEIGDKLHGFCWFDKNTNTYYIRIILGKGHINNILQGKNFTVDGVECENFDKYLSMIQNLCIHEMTHAGDKLILNQRKERRERRKKRAKKWMTPVELTAGIPQHAHSRARLLFDTWWSRWPKKTKKQKKQGMLRKLADIKPDGEFESYLYKNPALWRRYIAAVNHWVDSNIERGIYV